MYILENFVDFEGSRLHYIKTGTGPMPLLLFHGFGQDHEAFDPWIPFLRHSHTLYLFDLYFHGKSTWSDRMPLEKDIWKQIIGKFLDQEKISGFQLAGFSLGGKFAFATLEAFPEKVKKIILLAPDGVRTSSWYSLATYPFAIRSLFKSMVLRPGRFFALAKFFESLGFVDKGILRFAESQMNTEEKRRRVYFSWVYFRHLKFNMDQITEVLNQYRIPVLLLVGKYDKVIPIRNMEPLIKNLELKQVEIIESGHNDLINKSTEFLILFDPSGVVAG